ncbi:hypothetical protein [Bacteroides sp.]|uniref:hypothetical protein n=1 Tax=Bacteroides sp. TaxID=29523 RepID=UPI0026047D78|nr:hypothetical protein [Bacteroides sp.]MDD3040437.1 hypothetical protein [Bacteroides sp.]
MFERLIKKLRYKRLFNKTTKDQRQEDQHDSIIPSYNRMESYYKGSTIMVGCSCGNEEVKKEWDDDLGMYYYFYECLKCNYYWEGPIYCG